MAVSPDGGVYVSASDERVRRISSRCPGIDLTDALVSSPNGGELFVFSAALLYQAYESQQLLVRVVDGNGNALIVERDGSGTPQALVAPFGQRTELLVTQGFLESITNPNNETVSLQYKLGSPGLLETFTDGRGGAFGYSYDIDGGVSGASDPDALGNSVTYVRATDAAGVTVTATTPLGLSTAYSTEQQTGAALRRIITRPDGTAITTDRVGDSSERTALADGTIVARSFGPDPRGRCAAQRRFASAASLAAGHISWKRPSARMRTATVQRIPP